jgi:hypothetical protein
VVVDHFGALGTHHLLGVPFTLGDGRYDTLLRWGNIAHSALGERAFNEHLHLLLQLLVGDGLVEHPCELSVSALEALQEVVSDMDGSDFVCRYVWGLV